jgi:hypothetical protein
MHRFLVLALLCLIPFAAEAQQSPVLSPRDSVILSLDTNTIRVNYGRPSMRGRTIMGGLVPWNTVWRTGANQATHINTNFDMLLGGAPLLRGTSTLWTLPSPDGWKIIINSQTGQWGTVYNEGLDRARITARVETLPSPVDTFTIRLEPTGKTSGVLKLLWERTAVSVPFERNDHLRPLSPLDSARTAVKGKSIRVKYSKPFARGRSIWGVVVPYDSVWRTGANQVTAFTTETDLQMGGLPVPRGSYALYSIPTAKGLTLLVNRQAPGTNPKYDPSLDVARIPMTMEITTTPVDPFRIWFDTDAAAGVRMSLGWADRTFSVPVRVP